MAFSDKNDAVSKLTTSITSDSDPRLQPSVGIPVKTGNLQNYIQNLLDWVFPPNISAVDLSGKVLGVGRTPLTPNTNYANLEFMTMMPLSGVVMYPVHGVNINVGAGKIRGKLGSGLTPTGAELDGFLFLDGSSIDTNVSGNEIFKDLQAFFVTNNMYGNTIGNILKLPNMKRRVPLGYDNVTAISPVSNPSVNVLNYGLVGNVGGGVSSTLNVTQIPSHTHGVNINTTLNGNHSHGVSGGRTGFPNNFLKEGAGGANIGPGAFSSVNSAVIINDNGDHSHNVNGNTANNTGGGQAHENRMEYMVMNYIIKY